ncbi:unnamed protein product [Cuscuta europaea]|uniref:Uncharacterized protein n=1 Tax=Cuscuta europaea TaxID=41803 RepID=A0A9P0ZNP5_CUSEU|nr:unnamed protein product [Cuscuta europaea]CAH9113793.1 unnamed protein product [Cuscuta europaea]
MVTQEERHQNMVRGREEKPEAAAFAARAAVIEGTREDRVKCTFCNKPGHAVEHCFKRTGQYPEWWFDNPGRGRGGRGRGGTGRGGGTSRGRGRASVHAMQAAESFEEAAVMRVGTSAAMQKPTLTDEQWQQLIKMLDNSKIAPHVENLTGPTYEDADWSG